MNNIEPMRITEQALDTLRRTVGLHPPETMALLGGRPWEDPNLIEEVRFCIPDDSGPAHVKPNEAVATFTILDEWQPQGSYVVGVCHSHPSGCTSPSNGDLLFFRSWLESEDAQAMNWTRFLAPIITFEDGGDMNIHPWVFDRGDKNARKTELFLVEQAPAITPAVTESGVIGAIEEQLNEFGAAKHRLMRQTDVGAISRAYNWFTMHNIQQKLIGKKLKTLVSDQGVES